MLPSRIELTVSKCWCVLEVHVRLGRRCFALAVRLLSAFFLGDCDAASKVNGFTPLHCAADNGSLCCLKYLVEIGANLFAKTDKTCMTARDIAARKNMTKCREYLETEATSFYRRQKEMRQQRMISQCLLVE
jgi:hypothetical protein